MSGPVWSLTVANHSIQGRRPYNEDSLLAVDLQGDRTLVAVADGMGGHAAGEVASALALEVLQEAVRNGRTLSDACVLANERVFSKARTDITKKGMGTTLVAMLRDGDTYQIANVGDSRGYVVTAMGIRQVTDDHSFVAEAMRRGQTEDEARSSKWKDALTRSIGTDATVKVDVFGPFAVDGDVAVVLCSDGLFKALSDDEVEDLFARSEAPAEAAKALVDAAFEGGSDDNITVVIAEFGRVPRRGTAGAQSSAMRTLVMDTPVDLPPPPEARTAAGEAGPPDSTKESRPGFFSWLKRRP